MIKKILFLLFSFTVSFSSGQGIDNLWMMGYNGGFGGININFLSGSSLVTQVNRPMNFSAASATMCDTNGNVLFYTNGVYVANANNDTMLNGSGLSPSYYTNIVGWNGLLIGQAALILPSPDNQFKYYIFHGTVDDSAAYAYHLYYSEVDLALDNGLGAVTSKNTILLNDTLLPGRITATKHGNGRDWWMIVHKGHTNRYYIYLVDPSGIHLSSMQNIGPNLVFAQGQACFSPDGSKYAIYDATNDLDIMDFDRCSGQFSNPVHISINDNAAGGGVAFSSNSNVLYVSSTSYVYQFDLTATNISNSQTTVAVWDGYYSPNPPAATTFFLSQLAPDGKIYISSTNGVLDMHVINNPDSLGLSCDVCQHCIHLPAYNAFTIPNHPNYHLGSWQGSLCDTIASGVLELADQRNELTVFPNPVTRMLYVNLTTALTKGEGAKKFKSVRVLNTLGQQMVVSYSFIKNGEYIEINTTSLSQGVYLLELLSGKEKVVRRFVKE